ncbi:MAG: hypothetical protein V4581_14005 [Bacteroidota bacterium]
MALYYRLLLLLAFLAIAPAHAQDTLKTKQPDTVKVKHDQMYKKLEDYSKRRGFTKFLHKLIFRPVKAKEATNKRKQIEQRSPEMQVTYKKYAGKIVRKVVIQTLDPFGYSVNDTTQMPGNWVQRTGNRVHLKTKEMTIRNLLLFRRGQPLDSLLVLDSERLIRSQRYVRRVAIRPVAVEASRDSVDLYIRVLDSWSLIPNGSASGSGTSIRVIERNFFGLGHQFENDFDKRFDTGETSYLARYTVPNIFNSYINATVNYQIWESYNSLKSVGLDRKFFSAYTRWAGGAYYESRFERDSLPNAQQDWNWQNFRSDAQDFWGGYAFKIYKGDTEEERTTRLVTTARYYKRMYKDTPTFEYDSIGFYSNEHFYMASIGLTSRKFVQDKFLFNYDIVEDIPIGKVYSITGGVQSKNGEDRLYLGARYAWGNYYKWGYFSANIQVGSFYSKERTDQTTLRLEGLYFTNIKTLGRWRYRHFINPVIVMGDNRMRIYTDQVNINGAAGIPGFESRTLVGTKKAILNLQTQTYSPWNLWGFRVNPFANVTLGVIGDEDHNLYQSKLYSKIGVGVLFYNDYLVFNSFQLSLAYYPSIPDNGYNIIKINSVQNNDFILPDFQVGKPDIVPYN